MELVDLVKLLTHTMTGIGAASSIAGALIGSRRRIGAAGGLLLGMCLPVIGPAIAAMSRRTVASRPKGQSKEKDGNIRDDARKNAGERFAKDNPEIRSCQQHDGNRFGNRLQAKSQMRKSM